MRELLFVVLCVILCNVKSEFDSIKSKNFASKPIPQSLLAIAQKIEIKEHKDKQTFKGLTIYYQESSPPRNVTHLGDVLLLHEAPHSSDIWTKTVGAPGPTTIKILAAAGYRTIAVDLPGFPIQKSLGSLPAKVEKATVLKKLLKALNLKKPIIVSPTASGSFASPYVSDNPSEISGFVPIAVCCTDSGHHWPELEVPVLIIQGTFDGKPSRELLSTPYHKIITLPNSRNGGYVEHAFLFHRVLLNFLQFIRDSSVEIKKESPTIPKPEKAIENFQWENFDFVKPATTQISGRSSASIHEKTNILTLPGPIRLFYRQILPQGKQKSETPILLLHDRFSDSRQWSSTKTLALLAANGYRALAIDLPGFGVSTGSCDPCTCMRRILAALNLTKPFVISPEIAVDYILPLLYNNPGSFQGLLLTGYMHTNKNLYPEDFETNQVPLLAISDELGLKHYKIFGKMPNAWILPEKRFTSRPYINNLRDFHNIMLNFINRVLQNYD